MMSPMAGMMSPAAQLVGGFTPSIPKVCPALVMDNAESRFAVSLRALERLAQGSYVDIVATSLRPLLCLVATSDKRLDVCLRHDGSMPRCSIIVPAGGELIGEVRSAHDQLYAHVRFVPTHGRVDVVEILHMGRVITRVEQSDKFQYQISDPQGRALGLAKINSIDYTAGEDFLEIRSLPGTDAVLMIAVVLSHAIFYGR
jgi:hypothetical protein